MNDQDAIAEARRRLSSLGGQGKARSVKALKDAAAAGDLAAKRRLAKMARTARENGRKGGRPKKGGA